MAKTKTREQMNERRTIPIPDCSELDPEASFLLGFTYAMSKVPRELVEELVKEATADWRASLFPYGPEGSVRPT